MNLYFAPLEGITDDVFRRVHHEYFPGADRYYTPFLAPTLDGPPITKKELREVLPENNKGISLVPQFLTNRPEAFVRGAEILQELGYTEVNLNLGCPSGTVCAKGRGSGFLKKPDELEKFLDYIFERSPIDISIKTRLGSEVPEEFDSLLALYNKYPVKELTVHPRVRTDLYRGTVKMDWFRRAQIESRAPVSLSGGIEILPDMENLMKSENPPERVMIGRGAVANPCFFGQIRSGEKPDRKRLEEYHNALFQATAERLKSDKNTMFRMKEIWHYLILLFDEREKLQKQLRKTTSVSNYQAVTLHIFRDLPLREHADIPWK